MESGDLLSFEELSVVSKTSLPISPPTPSPEESSDSKNKLSFETGHPQNLTRRPSDLPATSEDGDESKAAEQDEDESDDENQLVQNLPRSRRITEKMRKDTEAFQSWIAQNQKEVTATSRNRLAGNHGERSVADLIEASFAKRIIDGPREYQIELFERAKEKNIIVVLDTGSGKTLIAALLLRHVLDQELEDRAQLQPPRVAFFLVEKVALCFQQYLVLSTNLEYSVAKFYGDMSGMMKTKEYWDAQLSNNMAIVCTAQILLDCLANGFIKIDQINLLVLDEAHHTKKSHPYARIVKDHYLRSEYEGKRPRILGMTASPVDAKTKDLRAAALELESLLCSEIATVSDKALLDGQSRRTQVEMVKYYDRLEVPELTTTPLWDRIHRTVAGDTQFGLDLDFSMSASSTLGPWCADRYWQLLLSDSEVGRMTAKANHGFGGTFPPFQGDQAVVTIHNVQDLVGAHSFSTPHPDSGLSSKVRALYDILEQAFSQDETSRCIVFVDKRYTAFLLADLFQQSSIAIPGMMVDYMVGSSNVKAAMANMSLRDQVLALRKFRLGETNCLFATPVAEEGIDIPECDLIVRFDIYNTLIQYIQSKGRARKQNSRYISMLEEGNMLDARRSKQATRDANLLRQFCSSLPEDRKVQEKYINIDAVVEAREEREVQKIHEIPSTGARLTTANSTEVLAKFVSSLPSHEEVSGAAEYVIMHLGKQFRADVVFPAASPIKSARGYVQRSKKLARSSAAFEACMLLLRKGYISDHLQPVFAKKLPAMRNARLAVSQNKKAEYMMHIKPSIWSQLETIQSDTMHLFVTSIELGNAGVLGKTRPLALITRKPLGQLPSVQLFFSKGHSSEASFKELQNSLSLDLNRMRALTDFTLKVFTDTFSKDFDASMKDLPYFIAPLRDDVVSSTEDLDWDLIFQVQANPHLNWQAQEPSFYDNKFVTDPNDGSRKFVLRGINPCLRPSDPTPPNVPKNRNHSYRLAEPTIKEYSNSLWQKARKAAKWSDDQPVVNADLLSLRRNLLDEGSADKDEPSRCYLILEPLLVSPIPLDVVSTALALPAMLHRIDSVLISLEACSMLGLDIRPDLALEALTKDSDNTDQHGEEQVNFQRGMGKNYERLELLGDTVLKMATTISVFTLVPHGDEFECHVERMLMLCNQNLFNHAVDRHLQEFIRSKSFNRRTWYPNLPLRKGKAATAELHHSLSDKSIADVCEAIIGAAYLTGTDAGDGMDMATKAVTAMVKSKMHEMTRFADYYAAYTVPKWQTAPSSATQRLAVEQIAARTGYRFRSAPLLRSVFKHPSYTYESVPSYERLEFLGDALLDMAAVDHLFRRFPGADPQWLTEHKMAMVSNQFYGCVCVKLGLHRHLLVTTSSILGSAAEYVAEQHAAEQSAHAAAEASGTDVHKDFWQHVSPPKALSDLVEALVGAMFVDARYDFAVVQRFFEDFIRPYFEDMELYDTYAARHPVTLLAQRLQADLGCRDWRFCVSEVPRPVEDGAAVVTQSDVVCALMVHGRVVVNATAQSGRYAKVAAAKKALVRFAGVAVDAFRRETGCDCDAMGNGEASDTADV